MTRFRCMIVREISACRALDVCEGVFRDPRYDVILLLVSHLKKHKVSTPFHTTWEDARTNSAM